MKLSNESKVSLLVSCIIIIIISQFDTLINALSIRPIIDNVLPLISIITIFLLGSVLSSPIYIWAKGFYNGRLTERHMSIYLRQLTEDEKHALCKYMNDSVRTCYFQLSDGVVNGLESKQILYKSSSIAELLTMSYNIQDVAYNILKKHPEYLNCSESKAI